MARPCEDCYYDCADGPCLVCGFTRTRKCMLIERIKEHTRTLREDIEKAYARMLREGPKDGR